MSSCTPKGSHFYCSYQVDFIEGTPIQCVKYNANSAICDNLGLKNILMPSIWSSPDQHYADNLLDALGDLVSMKKWNLRCAVNAKKSVHHSPVLYFGSFIARSYLRVFSMVHCYGYIRKSKLLHRYTWWGSEIESNCGLSKAELKGLILFQVYSGCHKFVREYNCRIHLTPCDSDDPIQGYPCRELCHEVHKYCPKLIEKFKEFNTCAFYPSSDDYPTCYRPEVTCPEPRDPAHGSVTFSSVSVGSEATYSCNMLFDLNGATRRTCQVIHSWLNIIFWKSRLQSCVLETLDWPWYSFPDHSFSPDCI